MARLGCLLAIAGLWLVFCLSRDQELVHWWLWAVGGYRLWLQRGWWQRAQAGWGAMVAGAALIGWVLLRSWLLRSPTDVLGLLYPLVGFAGVALLWGGWAGLGRARLALGCLLLTGIPLVPLLQFLGVMGPFQVFDAVLTQGFLGFVGIEAVRSGTVLTLARGAIEIDGGCSSLIPLWLLTKMALGWALVVPLSLGQGLALAIAALVLALGVNGVRLCLLAVLSEPSMAADFYFWHQGGGADLCATVAIVAFGLTAGWIHYGRNHGAAVED